MIQGMFWKWVFKKIWGLIKDANDDRMAKSHHKRIKALEKQMKPIQKNTNNSLKYTEDLEKEVAILKKDSHPQSDWICLECSCKAKKVEKPTRKRRKRKLKKEK